MSCWWRVAARTVSVAAAALALCVACAAEPPRPGIALITIEGWRADAAGFLGGPAGLTPTLDRLAASADWAGAAIAPASASGPALASVLTGLGPWRHQALTRFDPLPDRAITLAEALAALGYRVRAFRGQADTSAAAGFAQGAGPWQPLRSGKDAQTALAALGPGEFVWVHLAVVGDEYRRRDAYLRRLPRELAGALPTRMRRGKLMRRVTPDSPLAAGSRSQLRALYLSEIARVDAILADLLEGWERGAARQRSALVVVATRGEELGERGWVGDGRSLSRGSIEVPLVLSLPPSSPSFRARRAERPGTDRLWATLCVLAGGEPPAGVAPSLFEPAAGGVLSELYAEAGRNEFSWVDGDGQYRRVVRFADSKLRRGRAPRDGRLERRRRQERIFRHTLPWSGTVRGARIERSWHSWSALPTAEAPAGQQLDRFDRAARARWLLFAGPETPPDKRAVLY